MSPRIRLDTTAASVMVRAARTALPFETGGILVGYYEGADIAVTHALIVAQRKRVGNRYNRSSADANAVLRHFLNERELIDPVGYVGEWHSHPGPSSPSSLDKAAITQLANDAMNPLALIVVGAFGRSPMTALTARQSALIRAQITHHQRRGDQANPSRFKKTTASHR